MKIEFRRAPELSPITARECKDGQLYKESDGMLWIAGSTPGSNSRYMLNPLTGVVLNMMSIPGNRKFIPVSGTVVVHT